MSQTRVIVVGGGLAGLELAHRLDRAGLDDVVVLEQGPEADYGLHNNASMSDREALEAWLGYDRDPHFRRGWMSARPPHYSAGSGERAVLGGRSRYWYGVCLPLEEWALADWPEPVRRALHGSSSEVGSYADVLSDVVPAAEDVELEFDDFTMHRTPRSRWSAGGGRWYAYSPLDHWRDPVSGVRRTDAPGTVIRTGVRVTKVKVVDGRAVGVEYVESDGTEGSLEAATVVLAAGTIPGAALAQDALDSADELGGLMDHIVQGFWARITGGGAGRLEQELPEGSWWCADAANRFNMFIEVERDGDDLVLDVRATGEQERSVDNSVRSGFPLPVVSVRLGDRDEQLVSEQRFALNRFWRAIQAAAGLPLGTLAYPDYEEQHRGNAAIVDGTMDALPADEPVTWSSFLGTEDHESGTLAIGTVVDEDLQFIDVDGLYAAGPCVFPRAGAANPSLTTLALTRRLAEEIVQRVRTGDRYPSEGDTA